MSLRYGDNFVNVENPEIDRNFSAGMFKGSKVVDASNLIFPDVATWFCYYKMFANCYQLTAAPKKLNAVTLSGYCYEFMFQGCAALREAPELPASTLVTSCYTLMFDGCSSLNSIRCNADSFSNEASNWVRGVASSGTFYKSDNLEATYGTSAIPEGWTVKSYYNTVYYTLTWSIDGSVFKTETLEEGATIVEPTGVPVSTETIIPKNAHTTENTAENRVTFLKLPNSLIADNAGNITSADIRSEPTRFIASTIITAITTAIRRL